MLEVKDLYKSYKSKKGSSCVALKGLNIKFPDKGLVFVLGKSGSGKSTFLNVIGGLDAPDKGEIIIRNKSSKNFSYKDYDSYRNTYLGFIFQEYNVMDNFSVYDNVSLALKLQNKKVNKNDVENILQQVGLDGLEKRKPNELSGGQKQRVAIARALVKNPDIILADEPTGNLDSKTSEQIFDILRNLAKEKLIIIVSHDRDSAEKYADRIIELHDGQVINDVSKIDDTNIEFQVNDDEITIPYNKPLNASQIAKINDTISNNKNAKLKLAKREYKKTTKVINKNKSEFKLIKSRLPNKFATQIGVSNFAHKKFRLIVTIFLTVIALTLFGLSQTFAGYDIVSASANSFKKNNIDTIILKQGEYNYEYETLNYNVENNLNDETYRTVFGEVNNIDDYYGVDLVFSNNSSSNIINMIMSLMGKSVDSVYLSNTSGLLVTNEVNLKKYFEQDNLNVISGNLDNASNGVIVTDYFIDCFVRAKASLTAISTEEIYNAIDEDGKYNIIDNFGTTVPVVAVIGTDYLSKYQDLINTYNTDSSQFSGHKDYNQFASEVSNFLSIMYTYNKNIVKDIAFSNLGAYLTRYKIKSSDEQDFHKGMTSSAYMFKASYIYLLTLDNIDIKFSSNDYVNLVNQDKNNIIISTSEYNKIFNTNIASNNNFEGFEPKNIDIGTFKMFSVDNVANEVETYHIVALYEVPDIYSLSLGGILSDEKVNELNINNFARKGVYVDTPENVYEIEKLLESANDNYLYHESEISDTLYMVSQIFAIFSIIFQWVALILGIFSTILLFNFVSLSVINKKKEIGILRAIGAKGTDVSKIFLIEALIVGAITTIVSWGLMFLGIWGVNSLLSSNFKKYLQSDVIDKISLLSVGIQPIFAILIACLVVTIIATIIPTIKISRMRPVDAIKKSN